VSKAFHILLWAFLLTIVGIIIINIAAGIAYVTPDVISSNSIGIFFIILAFACFILEIFTPGFGLFTAVGVVSLTIGSLILFHVEPWLIALIDVAVAAVSYFVVTRVMKAQHRKVTTGKEELLGKTAVVKEALNPRGLVFYKGELWTAISDSEPVEAGEAVTITQISGIILHVIKKTAGGE
jgi:membrane-bound serine protease (ClpP class)